MGPLFPPPAHSPPPSTVDRQLGRAPPPHATAARGWTVGRGASTLPHREPTASARWGGAGGGQARPLAEADSLYCTVHTNAGGGTGWVLLAPLPAGGVEDAPEGGGTPAARPRCARGRKRRPARRCAAGRAAARERAPVAAAAPPDAPTRATVCAGAPFFFTVVTVSARAQRRGVRYFSATWFSRGLFFGRPMVQERIRLPCLAALTQQRLRQTVSLTQVPFGNPRL